MDGKKRLHVYMAECGVASRRKCEELIRLQKVLVNDVLVTELGYQLNKNDVVKVDGVAIEKESHVYYAVNKPRGYISSVSDEHDRKTVLGLLEEQDKKNRVYPVGRLDYDTQGLILLTNDGALAQILTNSANDVPKEYHVRLKGIIPQGAVNRLQKGVILENYKTKPAECYIMSIDKANDSSVISLTITEGKNHQVKLMCEKVGFPVKKLTRYRIASIDVKDIPIGGYRSLKIHEIKTLYSFGKK